MGDQDGKMGGDGKTSPFGNGQGGYTSTPGIGPNTNPMPAPASADPSANEDSIPEGGKSLPATLGDAAGVYHKPFKLQG